MYIRDKRKRDIATEYVTRKAQRTITRSCMSENLEKNLNEKLNIYDRGSMFLSSHRARKEDENPRPSLNGAACCCPPCISDATETLYPNPKFDRDRFFFGKASIQKKREKSNPRSLELVHVMT